MREISDETLLKWRDAIWEAQDFINVASSDKSPLPEPEKEWALLIRQQLLKVTRVIADLLD